MYRRKVKDEKPAIRDCAKNIQESVAMVTNKRTHSNAEKCFCPLGCCDFLRSIKCVAIMNPVLSRRNRNCISLCVKLLLLFVDLCINSFSEYARNNILVLFLMFIIQDLCLVLSVTLIVFSFLSAFIIQAGYMGIFYKRFCTPIVLCVLYLVMTITQQVLVLTVRWTTPLSFHWSNGLLAIYSLQKILAVIHYYFYKRTVLKFSDPSYSQTEEFDAEGN